MARTNTKRQSEVTHEGGRAQLGNVEDQLRRAVLSCMLWEDSFYEDGVAIADRIQTLAGQASAEFVGELAIEAKTKHRLRHAPMWLALNALSRPELESFRKRLLVTEMIARADELAEFIAMWWASPYHNGKEGVLPNVIKNGIADAFAKFDEYQFGKWKGKGNAVTLRDAFHLVHPATKDADRWSLYTRIKNDELKTPDTWETSLSGGADKGETFTRLLTEGKLGYLACLRNLRNMRDAGVDTGLIFDRLANPAGRGNILPFQFMAAAGYAPWSESVLDAAMLSTLEGMPKLPGKTLILVDTSGSMNSPVSGRSEMRAVDAACGMAIMVRELCDAVSIAAWSTTFEEIPARRGFALRDAIQKPDVGYSTNGDAAVKGMIAKTGVPDRIVMVTDMQLADSLKAYPEVEHKYIINVCGNRAGVGYGAWTWINGFSTATIDYMRAIEG